MLIEGAMTDAQGRVTKFEVDAEGFFAYSTAQGVETEAQGRLLWGIQELIAEYEEGDL